jgi:hypothetical protein
VRAILCLLAGGPFLQSFATPRSNRSFFPEGSCSIKKLYAGQSKTSYPLIEGSKNREVGGPLTRVVLSITLTLTDTSDKGIFKGGGEDAAGNIDMTADDSGWDKGIRDPLFIWNT